MKKHLFYASLFLAALSSCSKDDDRVSAPAGEVNNDLEEIKLAVTGAEAFNVQTRGTGVVGGLGTQEDPNNWNGQTLYVLMTDSGTVNKITSDDPDVGYEYTNMPTEILWNVAVKAPETGASGYVTGDGETQPHYYYPVKGNYDFYGYHVDDAAFTETTTTTGEGDAAQTTTTKTASELKVAGNDLTLDVTIDGSQDLLVAKADWATDVKGATGEFYPNAGGYKYGAYAARRGVQPTLNFKHLLTQLQFSVENESQANAITVTSINVTSKYTATMTVAGENFGTIAWNPTTAKLEVQDKKEMVDDEENEGQLKEVETETMNALDPVELAANSVSTEIGNLLVAASGEDAPITMYEGEITLQQTLDATLADGSLGTDVVVTQTVPFKIALPATSVHPNFLAGHAYNVKIYVYGLSLIKVTADLTAWENGGGFEVTPEDQVNTGESATFTPTEDDLHNAWIFESTKLFNTLTGEKSFGEKSDTLLAYLASGYQISNDAITRAASVYTFEKFINENKAEEFKMTYFIDNGFTNENDEVTIESTISAKIAWEGLNITKSYPVTDQASFEANLPESYKATHPWNALREDGTVSDTQSTLPWLVVEFDEAWANTLAITVEGPNAFKKEISYPTVVKKVSLLTLDDDELGTELVPGTWTVTVNNSVATIEIPAPTTDEPEVEEGENTEVPAE